MLTVPSVSAGTLHFGCTHFPPKRRGSYWRALTTSAGSVYFRVYPYAAECEAGAFRAAKLAPSQQHDRAFRLVLLGRPYRHGGVCFLKPFDIDERIDFLVDFAATGRAVGPEYPANVAQH